MTHHTLSMDQARRLAVQASRLASADCGEGKEGIARVIDHLGYVQIDTISVVARAHHHTLWARCPDYDASSLHDLQAVDRRIFEYWAHAIAFLPIDEYRFYLPRMQRHRTSERAWLSDWKQEHGHILDEVLERIRKEGALTSKDFEPPPGTVRGQWWDWKPAKRALEILFWQGDLMISERRKFQKVYDLTERVLPSDIDRTLPTEEELGHFHVVRALRGQGIARAKEIRDAFHIVNQSQVDKTLEAMCHTGEVMAVSIEGLKDDYYVLPETMESVSTAVPEEAHILSPFDNLTIQRDRMERLFDFTYTIECYVPAAKRQYGYFVLPILWQDQMIGRLDAKADRKAKTLIVKKLWFEPAFTGIDDALPALADALAQFAEFNGCHSLELGPIVPTGHKRTLKTLVNRTVRHLCRAMEDS